MDPASIPAVPPLVELAIYCYFAVVAAIGCYIHGRLWVGARANDEYDGGTGSSSNP